MSVLRSVKHDVALERLQTLLTGTGRNVTALLGPAASGKSYVLAALVEALRRDFSARFACGDVIEQGVDEHVLSGRVERLPKREIGEITLDAAEDIKDILDDGDIPFGRLIHRAVKFATSGIPAENLSDTQQRFLSRLVNILNTKRPLLVCDDLHYWDRTSLLFLRRLIRGQLDESYRRLRSSGIVIALDPDRISQDRSDVIMDILGQIDSSRKVHLRLPTRSAFGGVLTEMGLPADVSEHIRDNVFVVTNGNLALARSLVTYLQEQEEGPDSLPGAVSIIFEQLMAGLGPDKVQFTTLLGAVVASGRALDLNLLGCIMNLPRLQADEISKRAASKLPFVSSSETAVMIDNETIREILEHLLGGEQKKQHLLMEQCIRRIRPGDYGRRAAHLQAGGQSAQADAMRIMDRLNGIRSGRYGWQNLLTARNTPIADAGAADWTQRVGQYFQRLAADQVEDALEILENLPEQVPHPLPLEAKYLCAQLLSDFNSDASVQRALGLVEELDTEAIDEREIWGRAKELEILCLSHLRRPKDGHKVEIALRRHYHERALTDPDADLALNRLKRKSEAIHVPDVANDRLKAAAAYFGPHQAEDVPIHWAEYLISLNNLCANEIVLGKFESAHRRSVRLSAAATTMADHVLRKPEYIWSNVLIVQYLLGRPAGDLVEAFEAVVASTSNSLVDTMLLEINLATVRANANAYSDAYSRLAKAYDAFNEVRAASPYVRHFASSNLACLAWINRDVVAVEQFAADAEASLQEMAGAEYSHPFLVRRHELLQPTLYTSPQERDMNDLERAFLGAKRQIGPSWRLFGRALLVTDIQYWSAP